MAGSAKSDSRMNVTLQGYDQVIALSQATINQSLKFHFANNEELCKFAAKWSMSSLTGTLGIPTVELIDKENADEALYILHFEEGTYRGLVEPENEDDLPTPVKVPANGWKLAFRCDFALKTMGGDPGDKAKLDKLRQRIPIPGDYSVEQLVINFGDLKFIYLDVDSSHFPLPKECKLDEATIKASLKAFIGIYIEKKLATPGHHNVLGYAVKSVKPQGQTPSFVPTACRLQTIQYRPDGDAERASQDNPYNAFLFTEMTQNERLPLHELKYSGDLFYDSIGGTMVMSRRIFWDDFMTKKLQEAHGRAVEIANGLANYLSSSEFEAPDRWCFGDKPATWAGFCDGFKKPAEYATPTFVARFDRTMTHSKSKDRWGLLWRHQPGVSIQTTAMPELRGNKFTIHHYIEMTNRVGFDIFMVPATLCNFNLTNGVKFLLQTTVEFTSVNSLGELRVAQVTEMLNKEVQPPKYHMGGLGDYLPKAATDFVSELIKKAEKKAAHEAQYIAGRVDEATNSYSALAGELEAALNGQGNFIFPGNGTFDIKDPIFNSAGDLMLGLTYRDETD